MSAPCSPSEHTDGVPLRRRADVVLQALAVGDVHTDVEQVLQVGDSADIVVEVDAAGELFQTNAGATLSYSWR